MHLSNRAWRRLSLVALILCGIVVQSTTGTLPTLAASTDMIISAMPGHHYSATELEGYTKAQLIELVESFQAENESITQASPTEPPHHSAALAVIGAILGGVGFAMLASRVQSHIDPAPPTNQFVIPSSAMIASVHASRVALQRVRVNAAPLGLPRPITVVPFTASSCNSNSQLFCNVNVKTDFCNSLSATQAFVTSMSSLVATNQASKGTTVDQNTIVSLVPSPGASLTPSPVPSSPASTGPGMMPVAGAAAALPLSSTMLSNALASYGYSSQQIPKVLGALSSGGVALLNANGQATMTKSGAVNGWQVGSVSANFLISLANIWAQCNNQVTTSTSPAPKK